jgi:4-hydroxythreonine-4-phosphate dehydrogenase
MTSHLPTIAMTMGDPAGVGPEVVAAVWNDPRIHGCCRPVVLGDTEIFRRACDLRGAKCETPTVGSLAEGFAITSSSVAPCLPCGQPVGKLTPGEVTAAGGEAAYQAVVSACQAALAGECDAIVTAPLSKAALHAAGRHYPGHTELLAELCGVDDFAMMLYLPPETAPRNRHGLGVVHVTLHTSLRSVFDLLSIDVIAAKCALADQALRNFGCPAPLIGVAALNPHAGEGGLFGDEESRLIAPAVAQARAAGINAIGPLPVDTLMVRATQGEFDAVVAMYHDQGHIALKLLAMHSAVNVTLGLPIVRTSVAHGTAADLAWKGIAETSGMIAATLAAASLTVHRGMTRS